MTILSGGIYILIAFAAFSVLRVACLPKRDGVLVDDVQIVTAPVSETFDGR